VVTEPTVSGVHEMERVVQLADFFKTQAVVCVNKYDLNQEKAREVEDFAIQKGVTFLIGHSILKANLKGKRCEEVYVHKPPISDSHSADCYILATGRFVGGGLKADEEKIYEPVFNLPISQPKLREDWFKNSFFHNHPIHQAGISTDPSFRPIDERGNLVLENVWVAGTMLAHHHCIDEKSREGIEISTGYWAAKNAFQI
jgi:glycerol-3-phosphate dehydrogenase subunit B